MTTAIQSNGDLFQQVVGAWQSAIESGVKVQEQSAHWLSETCCNSDSLAEWHRQGQAMLGETIAKAQNSIEESLRAVSQQAESSVQLMQKALDSHQGDASSDAGKRSAEWWDTAIESVRVNYEGLLQSNSRVLTTWSELVRKISSDTTGAMSRWAQEAGEQVERMAKSAAANVTSMVPPAAGV